MRTIYIGDERTMDFNLASSGYEYYSGYDAYRILLEVVSGLRSKLLGETEVMAQFRERFKNEALPVSAFGEYLRKLRDQIIEDSRKLRSEHLRNLGDQSYGGIAHRYLKNCRDVILVGTGQLAMKLIPWLLEGGRNVKVLGRNPGRLSEIAKAYNVNTGTIEPGSFSGESVVVAAPVPVAPWVNFIGNGATVVDFREEPCGDEFPSSINYISFENILNSLKINEERNVLLRKSLVSVIDAIIEEREMESQHFVFGWEDIPCPVP